MLAHQYDDIVTITRDQISGTHSYQPQITDMHFGGITTKPQICLTTTRANWTVTRKEIGLVYCEDQTCILVPTICNNVSRIVRLPESEMTTGSRANKAPPPSELVSGSSGGGSIMNNSISPSVTDSDAFLPVVRSSTIPSLSDSAPGIACCYSRPSKPIEPIFPIVPPMVPPYIPPFIPPPIIPSVPEPSTILMLLFGLGVILLFLPRRKD